MTHLRGRYMIWSVLSLFFVVSWVGPVLSEESREKLPEQAEQAFEASSEPTERLLMGGTEIQGTIEKPHVVYIVPWKKNTAPKQQALSLERSFREEILAPVDYDRFQRQWGTVPRKPKGGE